MKYRRELISGFVAALVCAAIIGGSFVISLAERGLSTAGLPQVITSSPFPTIVIPSPRPGEPTLTPSLTSQPSEAETLPSPTSACPVPDGWAVITVNPGDTLERLAADYNTSVNELAEGNCLLILSLSPGTLFAVPAEPTASPTRSAPTATPVPCRAPWGWVLYTIESGDTLYSLGTAFGVSVSQLQAANCMGLSTSIKAGEQIWVPNVPTITPPPSQTPTPAPSLTPSQTSAPPTPTNTSPPAATSTPTPTSSEAPPTEAPTPTPTPSSTPGPTLTPSISPSPTEKTS